MDFLKTILPSLHWGQDFSTTPCAMSLASFPASPSAYFDLHFVFMQNSMGLLPFFMAKTIGKLQVPQILFAGFIRAFDGSETVVLHLGYLLHAAKLPNLPFLICKSPSLQAGHLPKVVKASLVSMFASRSSLPISFSCFLKSVIISVIALFASSRTSAGFLFSSLMPSISSSKCLVSSSSTILGAYFCSVSTVFMPSSVASIALPVT